MLEELQLKHTRFPPLILLRFLFKRLVHIAVIFPQVHVTCVSEFLNTFSTVRLRLDRLRITLSFLLGIQLEGAKISKCLLFTSSPKGEAACFHLSMTNQDGTSTKMTASPTSNSKYNEKTESIIECSFCFFLASSACLKKKNVEVADYKLQYQNISLPGMEEGSCSCMAPPEIHHMYNVAQSSPQ